LKQSLGRTRLRRPDLLQARTLDRENEELLDEFLREQEPGMEPDQCPSGESKLDTKCTESTKDTKGS